MILVYNPFSRIEIKNYNDDLTKYSYWINCESEKSYYKHSVSAL